MDPDLDLIRQIVDQFCAAAEHRNFQICRDLVRTLDRLDQPAVLAKSALDAADARRYTALVPRIPGLRGPAP